VIAVRLWTARRAPLAALGKEIALESEKSIVLLNRAVADELGAVHQYMYFHFHLEDQGFAPLAALFKKTAVREMGHIEMLSERILFLGGDVEMAAAGAVERITDPAGMLEKAAQMEEASARDYNAAAVDCGARADSASKHLFEELVRDEEGHFDEFDRQMDHIKRFGPSYLALQSFSQPEAEKRSPEAD
jgi:bacterioferritin